MKKYLVPGISLLLIGYWLGGAVKASAPLPGGPDDPVVTKSFVDQVLSQNQGDIQEQLAYLEQQVGLLEKQLAELKKLVNNRIVLTIGQTTARIGNRPVAVDVAPYMEQGRTMLPFRFIGDALGAEVDWAAEKQTVTYRLNGTALELIIGSVAGRVNGREVKLDVAPKLVNGRTMVPLRVVSEHLGAAVEWNEALQQVTIIP